MTRLPIEDRSVKGWKWNATHEDVGKLPKYKVGPKCATGCGKWADHAHHIWRRSFLAGAYEYVELPDGTILGNLTGLCHVCHDDVTVNRTRITWSDAELEFLYEQDGPTGRPHYLSILDPRPPLIRLGAADLRLPRLPGRTMEKEVQVGSAEGLAECPSCHGTGRKVRRELPPGEKRPKKTWAVSVPVDARENGYEIIETFMDVARQALGRDDDKSWRYYTLVEVLAFFAQHEHEVAA